MNMSYGEIYKDRGMVKWGGFYLSEHTEMMENQTKTEANVARQKPQMETAAIKQIMEEAVIKHKKIAIQIEERDLDGHYKPDIVGFIQGNDELGIYVGSTKVAYDEIRHVAFSNELKWSDTNRFSI